MSGHHDVRRVVELRGSEARSASCTPQGAAEGATRGSEGHPRRSVRVLEADRDLGRALPSEQLNAAVAASFANVETVPAGNWVTDTAQYDTQGIGLLILDGFVQRHVVLAQRSSTELLGDGDLLRPWQHDDAYAVPVDANWNVVRDTRIALLDREFTRRMATWPSVLGELCGRAVRRSRTLGLLAALADVPGVQLRLLLLFWHLADRWGHIVPGGVAVPLRLSHATLGQLVGAQRPTVSRCLGEMTRAGVLRTTRDGWEVRGDRPWL